jgi:hypothetical protein
MGCKTERHIVLVEKGLSLWNWCSQILKGFFDSFTRFSTYNEWLYIYVVITKYEINSENMYLTFIIVRTILQGHPSKPLAFPVCHIYFQSPEIGLAHFMAPQRKNLCDSNYCNRYCYCFHSRLSPFTKIHWPMNPDPQGYFFLSGRTQKYRLSTPCNITYSLSEKPLNPLCPKFKDALFAPYRELFLFWWKNQCQL